MIYFISGIPYKLVRSLSGWLLRKDAEQFNLFGGVDEVPLTRKAKRRLKESPGQLSLFDLSGIGEPEPAPKLKPKAQPKPQAELKPKGQRKRAPKGGGYYRNAETGAVQFFQGGKFIPSGFSEAPGAVAESAPGTVAGLQVIQAEPEPAPVEAPAVEPAALRPKRKPAEKPIAQPVQEPSAETVATEQPASEPALGQNADYNAIKGRKTRQKINQQVNDLLERKQSDFSPEELTLLASYSGRGGIGTDDVSLNEYYTRSDLAKFTVDLLYQHGFKGGTLVEPSCGAGVFLHHGDRADTKVVGVEFNDTSAAVAQAVNPHAEVIHNRFERFCLDNGENTVDGIVGNVPFGVRLTTSDFKATSYKSQWNKNEDLFVDASLDLLMPEGMMALIVPHGVVSGSDHMDLRQELVKKGRVLGAYRLPESAFKHSDTSVVTDILLVQKHPDALLNAIKDGDTAAIAATADSNFVGGGYFDAHPQNVLGEVGTKKRGDRETLSVKGEINAEILNNAPELSPDVSYQGLSVSEPEQKLYIGATRYINGKLYRLNQNHRWELVEEENAAEGELYAINSDPSAYGTESIAEAEANLQDAGKRVLLKPDTLPAYLELAKGALHPADVAIIKDALEALNHAKSPEEREKIAHAVMLAGHIQLMQKLGEAEPIELQRGLAMLQAYREQYGNPATDRGLKAIALQFPSLLALQGAFDEDGKISDYFSDPDRVAVQIDRSAQASPTAAMLEAFRASGGEPVTIGDIRGYLSEGGTDADLEAALMADPTVGYWDGSFQPLGRLLVGNGYELMQRFQDAADILPEESPERRKLEAQIGEIRARLQPRAMEDITTPLWAVGSWIPLDAFNAFMLDRGYHEAILTPKGYRLKKKEVARDWRSRPVGGGDYITAFEEDVATAMNRGRISHGQNTKEAKEAVAAFELDLRDWLASSDYRLELEQNYNAAFNGDLTPEYSEEPLEISNCPNASKLHDYQRQTIRQMAEQGRGIISLGVGLGKTATSICLSQYLKQTGRAQKPCFVVPKSVLANWVREIGFWASDANVMILGQTQQFWADNSPAWEVPGHAFKMKGGNPQKDKEGNFILYRTDDPNKSPIAFSEEEVKRRGNLAFKDDDAATKERKLQQLSQNAYDLVLMSEPVFQAIGLDPEREYNEMRELMGKHVSDSSGSNQKKLYELQKRKEAKLADLAARRGDKSENITWEDLGIDCLIHDEAHHLKNLFGTMRTGDVAFLSTAESNRSLDFYYKSKYTREKNNNQNVYLLTATPTTNNPLEAFNMLQHVCPEEFEQRGIQNVDDFLQFFGSIETVTVPGVDLEMTQKNGLVGFKNLKDLRKLFNKYCRLQSAKDVGLPIPEERNHDVFVDMSSAQKEVYSSLKARAQELMKQQSSDRQEGDDHIFSVISDMDKAAIDLGYYDATKSEYGVAAEFETEEDRRSPKVQASVERVMASRAANQGKQIVFCDAVQLHDELKRQLVAAGYPENEISIVNAGTVSKSSDRQKVSQAYNDGRISLVIGNTATMGEGMNFQIGTTDIHHLTTPWTPAAIEQRNGRGVRQGNKLDEVNIHYYNANKSFDAYRKGVIERKRGWIDELWKGTEDEATNQNTGAMNLDEIAVMMSDDPEAARKQLESNREVQMSKFRDTQVKQSLKQFGQIQTMKQALSRMSDERKATRQGVELQERLKQAVASLSRNEFFPYKSLLDGSQPAYVGGDGTVILPGHHLREDDGTIHQVVNVDLSGQKFITTPVSGPDYRVFDFDRNTPKEIKFTSVGSARRGGVKPVEFNDTEQEKRLVGAANRYAHLHHLTADQIDRNRSQLLNQMREEAPYDKIPYLDPQSGDVKVEYMTKVPEQAQILFPHDGEAIDKVLRQMAKEPSENAYRYSGVLEAMTGRSYFRDLQDEVRGKVAQYRAEHLASLEQGEKAGDRKTESVATDESRIASEPQPTSEPAPAPTTDTAPSSAVSPGAPHPDPVTALKDGLLHLHDNNQDRAGRRNDVGFNAFDTASPFVQDMITKVSAEEDMTPAQHKAVLNTLHKYRNQLAGAGITLPTHEDLERVQTDAPKQFINVDIKKTRHAKRGIDLHVVTMGDRVARDKYDHLNQKAKSLGGWYSSYNKMGAIPGFQFEDRDAAEQFAAYTSSLEKSAQRNLYKFAGASYRLTMLSTGNLGLVKAG